MDSRPPNSTLLVAFVKFDKFDHDFYTFFALILHDLALSALWFIILLSSLIQVGMLQLVFIGLRMISEATMTFFDF